MGRKPGARRASKNRSPLWAKVMLGAGSVLAVVSFSAAGYAKIMMDKVNDSVQSECLLGNCDAEPGGDIEGPLNMLMIGSDMRKDWSSAQADTIMILHINKNLDNADIISIPRDLDVPINGSDCGGVPCKDKINSAFSAGGKDAEASVTSLAATVTDLTGVTFDGAAVINFDGFTDIVDELGGVELCLPFDMEVTHSKNEDYPLGPGGGRIYPKGCKTYGKTDALPIVRERYSYGPDTPGWTESWGIADYGRQHMQQHFIKQLLKKANEEGYIKDPTKVGTLISAMGDQLVVDVGGRSPVDFAWALRGINASSLNTLRVPSEPVDIDGTSYVMTQPGQQEADAQSLYRAIQDDELDDWIKTHPDWTNKDQ